VGLLHKIRSLAATDRRLLIETAVLLAAIRLALPLVSFKTLQDLLMRVSRRTRRSHLSHPLPADRLAWAITVASRYVPQTQNCLIQALAAWTLLAGRRHSALLRIGVANGPDRQFKAHAWVENEGKVVIGGSVELASYTPLVLSGTTSR
jgi:transglutaminase superfamily protein